jgi:glycosyltransferase involved in cell wall biosynthesis
VRICLITTEHPPAIGGLGQAASRIARGLSANTDHDVHVLWIDNAWGQTEPPESRAPGPQDAARVPTLHRLALTEEQHDSPFEVCEYHLRESHRVTRFDLFVAFGLSYTGFTVASLGKQLGVPTVVSIHGADLRADIFRDDRFGGLYWTLRHAEQIVSVNAADLRLASAVCDLGGRGVVIPNHIDPADFEDDVIAAIPAVERSSLVIAMAASFSHTKGLHVLLGAATRLGGLQPTILLIGDARNRARAYFQEQRLRYAGRLRMVTTGLVPHRRILSYLRLADIVALPSLSEGAPNVLLEAMLAGRAIVATDVGAIRDTIEPGVSGLIVEPGSVDELASALVRLAGDRELRVRLGAAARERVLAHYSPACEAAAWDTVFRSLVLEASRH